MDKYTDVISHVGLKHDVKTQKRLEVTEMNPGV